MSFLPLITSAVGAGIGKSMAGKVGQQFADKATSIITNPATTKALTAGENMGGTIGKAAGYLNKNADTVVSAARQAGTLAAPMIGARVGQQVGQQMDNSRSQNFYGGMY